MSEDTDSTNANYSDEELDVLKRVKERQEKQKAERKANAEGGFEDRETWKPEFGAGNMHKGIIIEGETPNIASPFNNHNIVLKITLPDGKKVSFFTAMYPVADQVTLEPAVWPNGKKKLRQEYRDYLDCKEHVMNHLGVENEEDVFPFKVNFMRYKDEKTSDRGAYTLNRILLDYVEAPQEEVQFELDSL
tara:strand:- start:8040 stop:8609 length:570 start_codon:yes stop_codon:yes gene_type:complete